MCFFNNFFSKFNESKYYSNSDISFGFFSSMVYVPTSEVGVSLMAGNALFVSALGAIGKLKDLGLDA